MKEVIEELETDSHLKNTQEWGLVEDRYDRNIDKLRGLFEEI